MRPQDDGRKRGKNRQRGEHGGRHDGNATEKREWWLTAVCYNCNETGHTKRFCPKLAKPNTTRRTQKPTHTSNSKRDTQNKGNKSRKKRDKGVTLIRGEKGERERKEKSRRKQTQRETTVRKRNTI